MHPPEVAVCIVTPASVPEAAWPALHAVLDEGELAQSSHFRFDADRRAYVLAHGLRRLLLARELGVQPEALRFGTDDRGRPFLLEPWQAPLFFSHSRNRHAVAVAVTRCAPVGIDIEHIHGAAGDFALLSSFMDITPGASFHLHWTALEAFWKAEGIGLATGNPRVRLLRRADGTFVMTAADDLAAVARAAIAPARSVDGCVATVALATSGAQQYNEGALRLVDCDSPFGLFELPERETAP